MSLIDIYIVFNSKTAEFIFFSMNTNVFKLRPYAGIQNNYMNKFMTEVLPFVLLQQESL